MAQQAAATIATCTHGAIQRGIRSALKSDRLSIYQHKDDTERADQQSVQSLVDRLHSDDSVKELNLDRVRFSDEGFNALLDYFASNTATSPLTKVGLSFCDFGPLPEHVSLLLAAMRTNASVTDLTISNPQYQVGHFVRNFPAVDSDILAGLLQKNNPPLQKLCLRGFALRLRNAHTLRRVLGIIPHLTKLQIYNCQMHDADFQVITDGLVGNTADGIVGNTTLDVLDISGNSSITSNALLSNVARLLESTQLKELKCGSFTVYLINGETVQSFATGLSTNTFMKILLDMEDVHLSTSVVDEIFQGLEHNSTLENLNLGTIVREEGDVLQFWTSLPRMHGLRSLSLSPYDWHRILENPSLSVPAFRENTSLETLFGLDLANIYGQYTPHVTEINGFLVRNRSNRLVRHANALLALQPRTGLPIASKSGIWYMAMAKLGPASRDHPSAATSAIFHILHMRPAIFELQLKRPREGAQQEHIALDGGNNNVDEDVSSARV